MKNILLKPLSILSQFVSPEINQKFNQVNISTIKYSLIFIAIVVAYIVSALLGFEFASVNNNVTLIWVPAGIALAAILHYGIKYWPAVFIGATIANIFSGSETITALSIAVGNTTEVVAVYWMLAYYFTSSLTRSLENPRHVIRFVLLVSVGSLIASVNGATVLALQVFHNWQEFYQTLIVWWIGDAMAMLLITPFILIWLEPVKKISYKQISKSLLLLSAVIISLFIGFSSVIKPPETLGYVSSHYPLAFIPMAALLIVALFSGPRLISLSIFSATAIIIISTTSGHGPFVRTNFEESIALIYLFISISTICAFSFSYMVRQRDVAQEELRIGSDRLNFVMQSTEDGVWDWDFSSNEIYISPTFKKMLGYDVNDDLGSLEDWTNRLHPEDRENTLNLLNKHYAGKSDVFQSEFRFRSKNGEYIWILGRGKNVNRDSNEGSLRIVGTCVNLMVQKKKEAKLELASQVIQNTPEGIMITSADNKIIDVNPAFTKCTGYSLDDVIGKQPSFLSSGRHDQSFYQNMWSDLDTNGCWEGEIWNRRKNGEIYPEWMYISAIKGSNDTVLQYAAILSDIGNQQSLKQELHNFAYYDALTNLPNRDLLIDRLNISLQQSREKNNKLAILLIDLDRFKVINETLGHSIGDALLQEIASILNSVINEGDTLARMGGDEFIILLPEINAIEEIARLAEDILQQFSEPHTIHGHELHVTCSIGIAVSPDNGNNAEDLIKNADTSMYQAKDKGFNEYSFYHSDMSAQFQEQFILESQLRYAVERKELFLEYQPQHDISTGRIIGMEALVRWQHPEFGVVPPDKFISIAENSGLIISIGEWIINQAIKDTSSIRDYIEEDFRVAINLSVLQLVQSNLLEIINKSFQQTPLSHQQLELEITESILMKNIDDTLAKLNALSDLGIKISIDDFGTGYSSLSYLKKFPISKLKIDKSFVDDVCVSNDDAEIASTIIAMGHNLHMKVIAEGVENAEQQEFLLSRGCDEVQGYYYSRPLVLQKIVQYIKSKDYLDKTQNTSEIIKSLSGIHS